MLEIVCMSPFVLITASLNLQELHKFVTPDNHVLQVDLKRGSWLFESHNRCYRKCEC